MWFGFVDFPGFDGFGFFGFLNWVFLEGILVFLGYEFWKVGLI